MHAVKDGPANRSFGLQVAALAGLPKSVIADARRTLAELERGGGDHHASRKRGSASSPQLGLFATPPPAVTEPSALDRAMADIDPDALTPREALEALYRLKGLLTSG